MDWVKKFYEKQEVWAHIYSRALDATEYERLAMLEHLAGSGSKRILELGSGGGQFASAAAADGHHVIAVEVVPLLAEHAQQLARHNYPGSLMVIQDDFYEVHLKEHFDVICYWDGFGIGTDQDQQRLLHRMVNWLAPEGCILLDIYTPWYWANIAGREMQLEKAKRRYDFDVQKCRLLDSWWSINADSEIVTQSLRCYSLTDLTLLLQETGLRLQFIEPGGAVDYEAKLYIPKVPLRRAMSYTAKLTHSD